MIEKIDFSNSTLVDAVCAHKINEIIDWIDDVSALHITNKQVTANLPNIDAGELAFLSKENSELKDEIDRLEVELERTRKALDVAVDALKDFSIHPDDSVKKYAKKILEQITALEQKD